MKNNKSIHFRDTTLARATLRPGDPKVLNPMNNMARACMAAGKNEQALSLLEQAFSANKAEVGPEHPRTLSSMGNLALLYWSMGKLDQAQALSEESLRLSKATRGPDHPAILGGMINLASMYMEMGKFDQATALLDETVALHRATLGPDHPQTLISITALAGAYWRAGKSDQALPLLQETIKLCEAKLGPDHPRTLESIGALEGVLAGCGKYTEADALGVERLARTRRHDGINSIAYADALFDVGSARLRRYQWSDAEPLLRESLGIREKLQPDDRRTFSTRSALGGALLGQGKPDEAERLIVEGYHGLKARGGTPLGISPDDDLNEAMDRLVLLAELRADHPQAEAWRAEIERVRHMSDAGAIRRWLVLEPIELAPGLSPVQGIEIEQLKPEAQLRPRAGEKVSVSGVERVWRERALRDYAIDFNDLQGEVTPRSVAYAVSYVRAATPQKGLVLKIGSDDQARVYLNGQKIYEQKRSRGLQLDGDTVSNVELRAGLNVILFKVVNGDGFWRGSVRFATGNDQPVEGIQVTLDPGDPAGP